MPSSPPDWRARADQELLVAMPRRGRIALEAALLLLLVFGEGFLMASAALAAAVLISVLALAMALVRPWSRVHGGVIARVAATVLVVLAVVVPGMVQHPELGGPARRLGIEIAADAPAAGDPPISGGLVRVNTVEPHLPADGVLRPGDRIAAVNGAPLDKSDPVTDLIRRTHGDELPEDIVLAVLRDGGEQDLAVHLPRPVHTHPALGRRLATFRELAGRHIVVAA